MVITVASGKGGTGKTTFAVSLAHTVAANGERVRLLDCDVEEPNDHLFVKPVFTEKVEVTAPRPVWDESLCTGCGACAAACSYNALAVVKNKVLVFNELCHSCGVCSHVCPTGALQEEPVVIGTVRLAPEHQPFFFADGLLNIGDALAPDIVDAVKEHADTDAVTILDASPGTACPVVKALSGAHAVVMVTEPTPFGLNDLKLAVAMALKMRMPTGIVINRSDGRDEAIATYAEAVGVPILGRIPFDRRYAETYSAGGILVEHHAELRSNFQHIYAEIQALSAKEIPPQPELEDFVIQDPPRHRASSTPGRVPPEVTIISGKGGTGKTTVTASFAVLAEATTLVDCDVDAADLHLLLKPRVHEAHAFSGGKVARIDPERCIGCGACAEACHFGAIETSDATTAAGKPVWRVNALLCEGCGLCPLVCPVEAIAMDEVVNGTWFVSETDHGPMVHARLGVAEENSGKLVAKVRRRAAEVAAASASQRVLTDGPPGTGCPVIASISGTDLVVIVTEPTVSGVHDLERVLDLCRHFGVRALVIINKADLNAVQADRIERLAADRGSGVVARIPFDMQVHEALMQGKTLIEYGDGPAAQAIRRAWPAVCAGVEALRSPQS